jgi:hypothetical protein
MVPIVALFELAMLIGGAADAVADQSDVVIPDPA